MTSRKPDPLPPPTMRERADAAKAARALRAVITDHSLLGERCGERTVLHIAYSRPSRGVWIERWSGVPGFCRVNGRYEHDLLPGWSYARAEIKAEMIPDLELLAERGLRPTEETISKEAAR